ncbi:hypothetical protein GH714_036878 [Hevea brasiliensis]|uniref:Uncharacterized protein n=1 Tax=Hevea brasiliensis TaxID=3981 RepID=A0A6A6LT53_HEVBR|nr:hypothetical protein GH714_036878 [Hevea brasiliensis]
MENTQILDFLLPYKISLLMVDGRLLRLAICSSVLWIPIELNLSRSIPDKDVLGLIGSETTDLPENEFLDLVLAKDIATVPLFVSIMDSTSSDSSFLGGIASSKIQLSVQVVSEPRDGPCGPGSSLAPVNVKQLCKWASGPAQAESWWVWALVDGTKIRGYPFRAKWYQSLVTFRGLVRVSPLRKNSSALRVGLANPESAQVESWWAWPWPCVAHGD